jgi:hypothetical protein
MTGEWKKNAYTISGAEISGKPLCKLKGNIKMNREEENGF